MTNNNVNYDATKDVEMEQRSVGEIVRNSSDLIDTLAGKIGRIVSYKYKIYIRNKPALEGELSLEEMEKLYKLYSSYGADLTQRVVSREFPTITFRDLKRILKAFNITKASIPLAPHILEEKTLDEQEELHYQNSENLFLKRIDQTRERQLKKKYEETLNKFHELKSKVIDFKEFAESFRLNPRVDYPIPEVQISDKVMVVYLSDMHIGSKVSQYSIYANDFNAEEAKRRMTLIFNRIIELSKVLNISQIVICNLGDSLDGYNAQTTRGGHSLPQNLDNKEQFSFYLELMADFFNRLSASSQFSNIKYYCVPGGNHDGDFGYFANKALESLLKYMNPNIEVKVFDKFIESFKINNHSFIVCHGKDEKDMFKNLPLIINDKTENIINEYIRYKSISGTIHFVKGDLHQTATTYAKNFRYKSVSSFFGSSEWIHKNFGNTKAACDIDVVDGDQILETKLLLN